MLYLPYTSDPLHTAPFPFPTASLAGALINCHSLHFSIHKKFAKLIYALHQKRIEKWRKFCQSKEAGRVLEYIGYTLHIYISIYMYIYLCNCTYLHAVSFNWVPSADTASRQLIFFVPTPAFSLIWKSAVFLWFARQEVAVFSILLTPHPPPYPWFLTHTLQHSALPHFVDKFAKSRSALTFPLFDFLVMKITLKNAKTIFSPCCAVF